MTAKELSVILAKAIADGYGDAIVLIDELANIEACSIESDFDSIYFDIITDGAFLGD